MIDLALASALKRSGLRWKPASGDRFAVDQPELASQVFTVSDMTIEPREAAGGTILGFNGTTEWALDSVRADDVVWLPSEEQLRELLGGTFQVLSKDGGQHMVSVELPGVGERRFIATAAADAYAAALLELMALSG